MIRKLLGLGELQARTQTVFTLKDRAEVVKTTLYEHVMKSAIKTTPYERALDIFMIDKSRDTRFWLKEEDAKNAISIGALLAYDDSL